MEDQVMALHTYDVNAEMLNASTPKEKLKEVHVFDWVILYFGTYTKEKNEIKYC